MIRPSIRTALLLTGVSLAAIAMPAGARPRVLFASGTGAPGVTTGAQLSGPVSVTGGLTQLAGDDGSVVSFLGAATFSVDESGAIAVQSGRFTATAGFGGGLVVTAPNGQRIALDGAGSAGTFQVGEGGVSGRMLNGTVALTSSGVTRTFDPQSAFTASADGAPAAKVSVGAQPVSATPATAFAELLNNAALNPTLIGNTGVPVTVNPALDTVPQGSVAQLLQQAIAARRDSAFPQLTAASNQLLQAQLAFLQAGGAAGAFSDATAASSLAAFVRFVAAGGTPGSYTALTGAARDAYLAYYNSISSAAIDAATRSQIAAYQSLVAAGVANVSSAAVAAAFATYVNYLQAGGAAPAFTGATTAQLQAYATYLRTLGVPATLDAATQASVNAYLAYLAAGGALGTVPAPSTPTPTPTPTATPTPTPTPSPTPTPTPTTPSGNLTGNDVSKTVNAAIATAGLFAGGPSDPGVTTVSFDSNGKATALGYYGATGTATVVEQYAGNGWVIGRFANGTFGSGTSQRSYGPNAGVHYVAQTPVSAVPASGTLFYKVQQATVPTLASGATFAAYSVDLNLGVTFGSAPKFGYNGMISVGTDSVGFSTAGGAAAPSIGGGKIYSGSGNEFSLYGTAPVTSATTGLCAAIANCTLNANFTAGGVGAATFGVGYGLIESGNSTAKLIGAAVLTQTATPGSTGTTTPTPTPAPTSGIGASQTVQAMVGVARNATLARSPELTSLTLDADGRPSDLGTFGQPMAATANGVSYPPATIDNFQKGPGWILGRFGAGGFTNPPSPGTTVSNSPGFVHFVALTPVSAIPTSGTLFYRTTAQTAINIDGTTSADVSLGVAYGSALRFGYNGLVSYTTSASSPTSSFGFTTPGGAANPSLTSGVTTANGTLVLRGVAELTSIANSSVCTLQTCQVLADFAAGGAGAVNYGMSYVLQGNANGGSAQNNGFLVGAAVLGQSASAGTAGALIENSATGQKVMFTGGGIGFDSRSGATVTTDQLGLVRYVAGSEAPERGTNLSYESGTSGSIAWTRWAGGTSAGTAPVARTVNQGTYLIWGTPTVTLPTTGTFRYALAGATAPTLSDGSVAPGSFTGQAAIAWGTTPRVGLNLAISLAGTTYNASTTGGAADPTQSAATMITGTSAAAGTFNGSLATTGTGTACPSGTICQTAVRGFVGGTNASELGLVYLLGATTGSSPTINGSAVFNNPTPFTVTPAAGAGPGSGSLTYTIWGKGINQGTTTGPVTADGPNATVSEFRTTSAAVAARGSAVDADNGGVAGVIGWSRWTNGTATVGTTAVALTANQGIHSVYGTQLTNLPTTGTAQYALAGATRPTSDTGNAAPGTFTGALAVSFAAMKVGWESTIAYNGTNYVFNTAGGLAAPSVTFSSTGTWVGSANNGTGSGPSGRGIGFLAGNGASHAGMSYFLVTDGPNGTISGTAAFTKTAN